jgi:hypothetical protein
MFASGASHSGAAHSIEGLLMRLIVALLAQLCESSYPSRTRQSELLPDRFLLAGPSIGNPGRGRLGVTTLKLHSQYECQHVIQGLQIQRRIRFLKVL